MMRYRQNEKNITLLGKCKDVDSEKVMCPVQLAKFTDITATPEHIVLIQGHN